MFTETIHVIEDICNYDQCAINASLSQGASRGSA